MVTVHGDDFSGAVPSAWGNDVNPTLDDKLHKGGSTIQTVNTPCTFTNTMTFQAGGYFGNGTTYYVNSSGTGNFLSVQADSFAHKDDTDQKIDFGTNTINIRPGSESTYNNIIVSSTGDGNTEPQVFPSSSGKGSMGTSGAYWGIIHGGTVYATLGLSCNTVGGADGAVLFGNNSRILMYPGVTGNDYVEFKSEGSGSSWPQIYPKTTGCGKLGTTGNLWNEVHATELQSSGTFTLKPSNATDYRHFILRSTGTNLINHLFMEPNSHECGYLGSANTAFGYVYAKYMLDDDGTLAAYDMHNDLSILNNMTVWKKNGEVQHDEHGNPIIDYDTIPEFLKGEKRTSGPNKGKRKYIRPSAMAAFSWGAIKQLHRKVNDNNDEIVNYLSAIAERLGVMETRLDTLEVSSATE